MLFLRSRTYNGACRVRLTIKRPGTMLSKLSRSQPIGQLWQSWLSLKLSLDPLQRQKSRLLDKLLLLVGGGLLVLTIISQVGSFPRLNMSMLLPELAGLLITALCYTLNRVGYVQTAALTFFIAAQILIIFYMTDRSDRTIGVHLRSVSTLLTIPIMAAGIIIGPLYSFAFATLSAVSILTIALLRTRPGVAWLETPGEAVANMSVPLTLFFVMAGLAWLFDANIKSLISQLVTRNHNLNIANRELAYKYELEQELSHRVDQITGRVSLAFQEQNLYTDGQITAVVRVSTTIEQLDQISEKIAQAATQVDSTAQKTLQVAEDGTANMQSGFASLTLLHKQAQAVANAMSDLHRQADQIDQIIDLITQISDETTILALNARIEAAGAGTYGRRFASVAQEVERLASRSREASEQVRQTIEEINRAIEHSSQVARTGLQETVEVMKGTRSMELALEGIVAMVGSTASLAGQISQAIQEQRGATVEVVNTVRQISSLSDEVAQGNQELMSNIKDLNSAVSQLKAATVYNS